ncbi:MAG TPA: M1 family metallopeptidase, partial [Blastocatellia bacterium]
MMYPRRRLGALALSLAAVILLSPLFPGYGGRASSTRQAPQAPPVQAERVREYHVDHYKIDVAVDIPGRSISGTTTVTLEPLKSTISQFELDAGEMKIESVALDGGAPLKFSYDGSQRLTITLDHPCAPGQQATVAVKYSATPKQGLTFITPTSSEPNRPYQVWSQGESVTNHYWFPCYDYPNDKATCETIVTVDQKYQVISNGKLVDVKANAGAGTKTWHWKMDEPYSSYLTSIVIGQFGEIDDHFKNIPVISYVYPGQVENGRISLGNIAKMVAFFSEKIGIDYPYAKYSETTVADFPGGMENISATTMTDGVVHDKRAQLDVSSDPLISHELAHQWFGDMLTCRDWGELWLNESFAEFFADLWSEHDLGVDDYLLTTRSNQLQY